MATEPYKLVKVIVRNGQHLLQMPNGDLIPGLVFTRVHDGCEPGDTYAIVKIQVELSGK